MTSSERANTGKDLIFLSPEQSAKFESSMRKRSAIAEAGETMAQNFSRQMQEALTEINEAYIEVAQANDLNLETHRYEYDPTRKALVLTQVAIHGKVR